MKKTCWKLFSSMLLLSGLTFGGGFVIIPLMQRRFVQELGWLTEEEILDMTAFARASPGAVTVNVAVQVGARVAGAAGHAADELLRCQADRWAPVWRGPRGLSAVYWALSFRLWRFSPQSRFAMGRFPPALLSPRCCTDCGWRWPS